MKTIIMLPTYNEAENIEKIIKAIKQQVPQTTILVVDDNSPDGTWKIVKKLAKQDKTIHLLHRTTNKGRGAAGIAGFKQALAMQGDIICEMDADFSHDPKYLPSLLEALQTADMVLGSRAVSGGKDADRSFLRQLITKLANLYTRLLLGIRVKDCNSGYRCFKRKVLEDINLDSLTSTGPGIVQEILYKVAVKNFVIKEVPISFIERKEGKSKLQVKHLYRGYFNIVKLRLQHLFGKL